ncbi:MAG TPA: uroporphyrinogen decarboxylase family protein [Clostridia bacterium]|nr:uroporphyrinogen decarboxylase family protein [Clostridia bacterium]
MGKESMTPRERWIAVLKNQKPDRLPLDYWATPEADHILKRHLNCSTSRELYDKLHIDRPIFIGPVYKGPAIPKGQDVYGIVYKDVDYNSGTYSECVYHPLAEFESVDEIEANYTWPEIEWYDYSVIPHQIKGKEAYPIAGGGSEPFLTYKALRGDEQAFMDLVLNPDIVDYCLDKLFGFCYENTARILEMAKGEVTYSYVAEDMGSERDLMFSPAHINRFLIPRMKKMIDLIHSAGTYVFHHNDGAIRKILPDLIEAGIDILNPIQWRCHGMSREDIKKDFGNDVVFHGGMDNQYTLAFGGVDEVKDEVIDNIKVLGADGGYILAPCHNIQAISPPENIVAMYETAYEFGWY